MGSKDRTGRMKCTRKQIETAINESLGNVTTICKRLGVSRQAFYEWKQKHPWVEELLNDEVEKTHDWVESKILKRIEDDDTTMMIFYAKTKMKGRGYIERQEVDNVGELPNICLGIIPKENLMAKSGIVLDGDKGGAEQ